MNVPEEDAKRCDMTKFWTRKLSCRYERKSEPTWRILSAPVCIGYSRVGVTPHGHILLFFITMPSHSEFPDEFYFAEN